MTKLAALTPLLTLQEAADYLGVCEDTVRSHVRAGDIRYISLGRGKRRLTMRFDPADLAEFIEAQRQRSAACPSTSPKSRRIINTTSSSKVIGFAERARQGTGGRPNK